MINVHPCHFHVPHPQVQNYRRATRFRSRPSSSTSIISGGVSGRVFGVDEGPSAPDARMELRVRLRTRPPGTVPPGVAGAESAMPEPADEGASGMERSACRRFCPMDMGSSHGVNGMAKMGWAAPVSGEGESTEPRCEDDKRGLRVREGAEVGVANAADGKGRDEDAVGVDGGGGEDDWCGWDAGGDVRFRTGGADFGGGLGACRSRSFSSSSSSSSSRSRIAATRASTQSMTRPTSMAGPAVEAPPSETLCWIMARRSRQAEMYPAL
jgi:hypothetical protein